jgi:adenylate cyclase
VLSQLPRTMANSASDEEFAQCVVSMLLETLPRVDTAAVLHLMGVESGTPSHLRMLCWDGRKTEISNFQISRTIVKESLQRQQGLIHLWNSDGSSAIRNPEMLATNAGVFDWTFCVPITQAASWGWCLYMSGFLNCENMPVVKGREELHEELRFVELLAQFIGALRELRLLENRKEGLKPFFSPAIRDNLINVGGDSVLRPRDSDISVLFCQIRRPGMHKATSADFAGLSQTVDENFRVMSEGIFAHHGVMADFQGESTLGFWGWPVATNDGPLPACRAALAMRRAQLENPSLNEARLICGIAHGPGMAGKIGPEDQCKMGVFGHVVNLGSRLRSMARQIKSGILLDAATAEHVKQNLPRSEGRCRKLGLFRPKGMEQATTVYELLLPVAEDPTLSDQHLVEFEAAVELISRGEWEEAKNLLHSLPSDDPCKHFLVLMIALHDYTPPPRWDGVFSLLSK